MIVQEILTRQSTTADSLDRPFVLDVLFHLLDERVPVLISGKFDPTTDEHIIKYAEERIRGRDPFLVIYEIYPLRIRPSSTTLMNATMRDGKLIKIDFVKNLKDPAYSLYFFVTDKGYVAITHKYVDALLNLNEKKLPDGRYAFSMTFDTKEAERIVKHKIDQLAKQK